MSVGTVRTTSFEQQWICALWVTCEFSTKQSTIGPTIETLQKISDNIQAHIQIINKTICFYSQIFEIEMAKMYIPLSSYDWIRLVGIQYLALKRCCPLLQGLVEFIHILRLEMVELRERSWFKYQIQGWNWDSNNRNFQSLYFLNQYELVSINYIYNRNSNNCNQYIPTHSNSFPALMR